MANEFVLQEYMESLAKMRLIDDTLMRKAFENNIPATETLLHIILENDKIKVVKSYSQYSVTNLFGHSVQLDVLAKDEQGRFFNVEVQSAGKGAPPQRARYYAGVVDTNHFPKSKDYHALFDTYVIFITKQDILGEGRPIYHIKRTIAESGNDFGDGSHIIYVNAELCHEDTALSKLMHDFLCTDPKDMYYATLKNRVKYYKDTEEGIQTMCEIMDAIRAKGLAEGRQKSIIATVTKMLKAGEPLQKIMDYSDTTQEEVFKIAQDNGLPLPTAFTMK